LIITTSEKWETLTRKWRNRKSLQQVTLYIFDHVHLVHDSQSQQTANVASATGAQYETLISRVRYIQTELKENKQEVRIVALSAPIATSKEICDWLGIRSESGCFNFGLSVRERCPSLGPLLVNIQSFDHNNRKARLCQMVKPTFNHVKTCLSAMAQRKSGSKARAIVFVSDLSQAQSISLNLVNYSIADESDHLFREKPMPKEHPIQDQELMQVMEYGVAWACQDMPLAELEFVKKCYLEGSIKVLVLPFDMCWALGGVHPIKADLVVIQDPTVYNSMEKRHQTISISTII